jgi:hypothetical protein
MSLHAALRGALVACLRQDAGLQALPVPPAVHDGAPRGADHPFIEIGRIDTRLLAATALEGEVSQVEILVRSRKTARGEAAAILDAARDALAGLGTHLSGHLLINAGDPETRLERHSDGRTWRGRLRLRVVTEPAG